MTEPAMSEQEYPPKMADQVDTILLDDQSFPVGTRLQLEPKEVGLLRDHIALLRRRVKKGENRKTAYTTLSKSHLMTLLELRWLRAMVRGGDPVNWSMVLEQAKGSLWAAFRKEQAIDKNSPQAQIDKLTSTILADPNLFPPQVGEGAVDTVIRLLADYMLFINRIGTLEEANIAFDHFRQHMIDFNAFLVARGLKDDYEKEAKTAWDDLRKLTTLMQHVPGEDSMGLTHQADMLIAMGGASAEQVINGEAPIGLTGPGGEVIFHGTWADLKERLWVGKEPDTGEVCRDVLVQNYKDRGFKPQSRETCPLWEEGDAEATITCVGGGGDNVCGGFRGAEFVGPGMWVKCAEPLKQ